MSSILLLVLTLVVLSCSGDGAAIPPASDVAAGVRGGTDAVPAGSDVTLRVRGAPPLVGKTVIVVDARGTRKGGMTDATGAVVVKDVVSPYDVAVIGAPVTGVPWIALGLTEAEAVLRTGGAGFSRVTRRTKLRVGVVLDDDGPQTIHVLTRSEGGEGHARVDVTHGGHVVVDVEHASGSLAAMPNGPVDVDVLVTDETSAAFRHGRARRVGTFHGETRDLGVVDTASVSSAPVSVAATSPFSDARTERTNLGIAVGGKTLFDVETRDLALAANVPLVPGGALFASVLAERGAHGSGAPSGTTRARFTATDVEGIRRIELALAAPPQPTAPAAGAETGARPSFRWNDSGGPGTTTVSISSARTSGSLLRVSTRSREVTWDRLAALGVGELPPGPYVLELETRRGLEVEDGIEEAGPDEVTERVSSRRTTFEVRAR